MPRTREQTIFGAREAARELLDRLGRQKLVMHFVDGYVTENSRRGLKDSPLRYKELLATITREALLAAASCMFASLPAKISPRKKGLLKGPEAETVETFRESLVVALAEALRWMPSEREAFRDDLELYARMTARLSPKRGARANAAAEGPFVDRCALLLDPSLLAEARAAAGKFQSQLEGLADEVLSEIYPPKRKS